MAKKKIKELSKELFEYWVKEFEEVETDLQNKLRNSMVDPEVTQESLDLLRGISRYIQNLNSSLQMALEDRHQFYRTHDSALFLDKTFRENIEKIKEQEPDSDLIETYGKKLEDNRPLLEILTWVKLSLELPRSKKRYKAWKKVDRGIINKPFYPFLCLQKMLQTAKEYIQENL